MNNREAMKLEALGDLRACLEQAKELGCIEVIDGADAHLEIGALQELSLRHVTPPILLFQNIKGYPSGHRVVVNVRSSAVFEPGQGLELVQSYRKHRRKRPIPFRPSWSTADRCSRISARAPMWMCAAFPHRSGTSRKANSISAPNEWSSPAIPTATG